MALGAHPTIVSIAQLARNIARNTPSGPNTQSRSSESRTFPVGAHTSLSSTTPIPDRLPSNQAGKVRIDNAGVSTLSSQSRSGPSPSGDGKAARPSDRERLERQGHVRKTSDPKAVVCSSSSLLVLISRTHA